MLQRFESRLEQAVSAAFARAFRSAVQPVEIAAALQREVDSSAQILSRDRRLVPNTFEVELSATDFERLDAYADTLRRELAQTLREYAEQQRYVLAGPVAVDFEQHDDLGTGRFRVRSRAQASTASPPPDPGRSGGPPPAAPAAPRHARPAGPTAPSSFPAAAPVPPTTVLRTGTAVTLEVDGRRHRIDGQVVVGRATDADLRIDDPGVSRRHAEFTVRDLGDGGTPEVVVTDLGSTNGTSVDGHRVERARLHDRARVRLGSTDLVVRVESDPAGHGLGHGSAPPAAEGR